MRLALVTHRRSPTNLELLVRGFPDFTSRLSTPEEALATLGPGDVALGRLDVRPDLDGVEDGLLVLELLEARGVRVLNRSTALLAAHDKLLTARVLESAGLPHPRTEPVTSTSLARPAGFPLVLKPRFGSWGRDVVLCRDEEDLDRALREFRFRRWFRAGAVLQELIEPRGYDVRVVVAGGAVVGAISRVAAPGEWRTNVALGGTRVQIVPDGGARALALAAAAATGADLVGVDLLPVDGGYVVIEVNAAVDFTADYSFEGDVFALAMSALAQLVAATPPVVAAAC